MRTLTLFGAALCVALSAASIPGQCPFFIRSDAFDAIHADLVEALAYTTNDMPPQYSPYAI